jgi:TRAP-type transport system periplasmic protein
MTAGNAAAQGNAMPKLTRRRFVGSAATAALASASGVTLLARSAQAAEFTYKYANNIVVDHP